VDEIWHAGDIGNIELADKLEAFKPFRAVYGNIDDKKLRTKYPEDLIFTVEGVSVWMTHIGGYPPRYNNRTRIRIKELQPEVIYLRSLPHP
jgi:predicted phosphodiesterase